MSEPKNPLTPDVQAQFARLGEILESMGSCLVAFSGGVDSTALAHAAGHVLGKERVVLATAVSESLPREELDDAKRLAEELGLRHELVATREIERSDYARNDGQRCYFCKTTLFEELEPLRGRLGLAHVVYGEMADDVGDHRPGARAASEHAVRAPLKEAGIEKQALRDYLAHHGVHAWSKPAFACLSSRVATGIPISSELLGRIERAERVLRELGYSQFRVRHHGDVARIELPPEDIGRAASRDRERIVHELRSLGWPFVTLDLVGYRTGSMHEGRSRST